MISRACGNPVLVKKWSETIRCYLFIYSIISLTGSDITIRIKMDKPLVVYIFSNVTL